MIPDPSWIEQPVRVDDAAIDAGDIDLIVEPVWWVGNIYEGKPEYDASLAGFRREQVMMWAVQWYLSEVCNGGHDQFYFNSTGIVWQDALDGLKAIGAMPAVRLLEASMKLMGGSPSFDRDERIALLDEQEPDFAALDDKMFDYLETEELDDLQAAYVKANRQALYFDSLVAMPKRP